MAKSKSSASPAPKAAPAASVGSWTTYKFDGSDKEWPALVIDDGVLTVFTASGPYVVKL